MIQPGKLPPFALYPRFSWIFRTLNIFRETITNMIIWGMLVHKNWSVKFHNFRSDPAMARQYQKSNQILVRNSQRHLEIHGDLLKKILLIIFRLIDLNLIKGINKTYHEESVYSKFKICIC